MSKPVYEKLKKQIQDAVERYPGTDPKAAMLSGISLAAGYLAKVEGGPIYPQLVASAVAEVSQSLGYEMTRLPPKDTP